MSHKEFRDLASPDAAREVVMDLDVGPGTERVPLADARGRVLAERVDASIDVPGFDRAAMDGYAVRAADTAGADEADPAVLAVTATVHAGEAPDVTVGAGEAVEISTGAVLPDGADAVVMVERTDEVSDHDEGGAGEDSEPDRRVAIRTAVAPATHVMHAGADVAAGERALGPGTQVTPREIGLLSALGVDAVPVRARPRVGIVSTGDELVRPGNDLDSSAGQIYDVNSYSIAAAVEDAGGVPELYPHVGDDTDEMERMLTQAARECDLVLSSGSTSASAVDVVYRVIEERGELLLHGVAIKPGKPMLVGEIGDAAYVGLPGYPVSALTIFRTFVAPLLREAAGRPAPRTATIDGRMATRERFGEGRRRLVAVGLLTDGDGDRLVYPVDKGSGATTTLTDADGVVDVPADVTYLDEGEAVTVELFSPDVRPPTLLGVGEADPALSRLLDGLDRPRFLAVGSRDGWRRLRDGVPDVAVLAGPTIPDSHDAASLGGWEREWGLVVPDGNPADVDGVTALRDDDLSFRNLESGSGLRESFDAALDAAADDGGKSVEALRDGIDGYSIALRGHESPARAVARGEVDAGLGLRATADRLGLGFLSLGTQEVAVLANPDRTAKPSVDALADALVGDDHLAGLKGVTR